MVDHKVLRELFRHLQVFEALFETEGVDAINGPDGAVYSVFDLRRLYDLRYVLLPRQRARAIEFFLYCDMREEEAAVAMGLSPETPVAIYATQGLKQLVLTWHSGSLWQRGGVSDRRSEADEAPVRDLQRA